MGYKVKIDKLKIEQISSVFKVKLIAKYELYLLAICLFDSANEEGKAEAEALLLCIERELFDAVEAAVSYRFPIKNIQEYVDNGGSFEREGRKKRDFKKSLFLDLVIAQMLAMLVASSELNKRVLPVLRS